MRRSSAVNWFRMRHLGDTAPMKRFFVAFLIALLAVPAAAAEPAKPAPAARNLILIRHGHYVADPAVDPALGPGLSSLGVAQSKLDEQFASTSTGRFTLHSGLSAQTRKQ